MAPGTHNCVRCGRPLDASVAGTVCSDCTIAVQDDPSARPAVMPPAPDEPARGDDALSTTRPGDSPGIEGGAIGPYRLLSLIAEGGMGVVYLAEQRTPHRRVALKVIKAGMDTRHVVARFETEREALAMMDHPNIATVFDAGETDTGRPYFAMEYVPGVPITDYCDRHQLSTRERLTLFLQVCAAIQHAHQKGIIHRDIKPSNVLVTVVEGEPVPKVIDFGVAKAISRRLTEKTLFTELGLLVGTPEYMSPEQAEMTGLDVDTTTDIYALGVLLYELLVGALPFDSASLRRAGYAEIQRIIRQQEPARPSTRITGLGDTANEIARRRHTDVPSLLREVRGDLDWITLRAMEKDRTRRYPSASEFAADVRRHLAHEPVVARPAGVAYRGLKFFRRHRVGVAASVAAVAALVVFGITMAAQSARIAVERDAARRERDRAERVSSFLVSLFEASDPDRSKGEKVTARQILDLGRQRLESELEDQPQTRAALLHTIGSVYAALDLTEQAEALLADAAEARRGASGPARTELADTLHMLARVRLLRGNLDGAEPAYEEVLRLRRELHGPEHPAVARAMANLGVVVFNRGQYDRAEQYYRQAAAMERRVGDATIAASMTGTLGEALMKLGRVTEAIALQQEALAVVRRALGPENTRTLAHMNNLAHALTAAGRYGEADPLLRELVDVSRKMLGSEHFQVAMALDNLGKNLEGQGRFLDAEPVLEEALAIYGKVRRAPFSETAWTLTHLASVRTNLLKFELAERTYREAIAMFEAARNAVPGDAAFAWDGLGELYMARHDLQEAERAFRRALEIRNAIGDKGHGLWESQSLLAKVECERGKPEVGEPLARQSVDHRRSVREPHPVGVAFAESVLGRCYVASGKYAEAEALLLRAHEALRGGAPASQSTRYAAASLVVLYDSWKKPEKAAAWRVRSAQ